MYTNFNHITEFKTLYTLPLRAGLIGTYISIESCVSPALNRSLAIQCCECYDMIRDFYAGLIYIRLAHVGLT